MSEAIPMVTSIDEVQALLDREDNLTTVARPVELPRVVGDGSPRCAVIIAGPEGGIMLNLVLDYIDALVQQAAEKAREARIN